MVAKVNFVNRCKAEKLALVASAAEVDKLLAETGCAMPGGAVFSARNEAAAVIVWLRLHTTDTAEQFDTLPVECQGSIRGLYNVLPDAPARRRVRIGREG